MKNIKRIALTVPPELHESLTKIAKLTDRTVTGVITEILKNAGPYLKQTAAVFEQAKNQQEEVALKSVESLLGGFSSSLNQAHIEFGQVKSTYKNRKGRDGTN
jgi:hypothetical protein